MLVMSQTQVGQLTCEAPWAQLPVSLVSLVLVPSGGLSTGKVKSWQHGDGWGLREEWAAVRFTFIPSCSFPYKDCPHSTAF